jgi:Tfp pilus assembly protein PilN
MRLINLLPKQKLDDLYFEGLVKNLWSLAVFIFLCALVSVGAMLSAKYFILQNQKTAKRELEQIKAISNKKENSELKNKIRLINSNINDYNTLSDKTPKWSNVISRLAKNLPEEIRVTSLSSDPKTGKMTISGVSQTRNGVLVLFSNIKNDEANFADIDYPLENLSSPVNSVFHFSFSIKPEAFK